MELIVCSQCGGEMPRYENIGNIQKDWVSETVPLCQVCRHVPGAQPYHRQHDALGGMSWKRDAHGKKVPK
jgi:hypothetical protein